MVVLRGDVYFDNVFSVDTHLYLNLYANKWCVYVFVCIHDDMFTHTHIDTRKQTNIRIYIYIYIYIYICVCV